MNIAVKNELDPVFETITLLYLCNLKGWQEETIEELQNYGVNGADFFQKHYKLVEKYFKVFEKHKITTPQEALFFENAPRETLLLIFTMAVEMRKYLDERLTVNPLELRSFLAYCIIDTGDHSKLPQLEEMPQLPDEKAIIDFLAAAEMKAEDRWYLLDLLRKPDYWLKQLLEMIRLNLPAYEKAREAVEKPLEKLLARFESYKATDFLKIAGAFSPSLVIYTSFAQPLTQYVLYSYAYQGILNEYLDRHSISSDATKESIIHQSKALGDKSKFEILCILKASNKYNLELSEVLGLSPSTTSHHMGFLLACGFVTVEKKDGKVYYCLQKETIRAYLSNLERLLL